VKLVADSFVWPFRGEWRPRWAYGLVCVALLPLLFIPLLGYAIQATREAQRDSSHGPPEWRLSGRLLADGFWTSLAVGLGTLPYLLLLGPLAEFLFSRHLWSSEDAAVSHVDAVSYTHLTLPTKCSV